jgi:hypothetical protein
VATLNGQAHAGGLFARRGYQRLPLLDAYWTGRQVSARPDWHLDDAPEALGIPKARPAASGLPGRNTRTPGLAAGLPQGLPQPAQRLARDQLPAGRGRHQRQGPPARDADGRLWRRGGRWPRAALVPPAAPVLRVRRVCGPTGEPTPCCLRCRHLLQRQGAPVPKQPRAPRPAGSHPPASHSHKPARVCAGRRPPDLGSQTRRAPRARSLGTARLAGRSGGRRARAGEAGARAGSAVPDSAVPGRRPALLHQVLLAGCPPGRRAVAPALLLHGRLLLLSSPTLASPTLCGPEQGRGRATAGAGASARARCAWRQGPGHGQTAATPPRAGCGLS